MEQLALGHNIKRLREEQGYTQESLGKLAGMSGQQISMYERGERKPGPKSMEAICRVLGVTEQELRCDHLSDAHRLLWQMISTLNEDEALSMIGQVHSIRSSRGKVADVVSLPLPPVR